MAVSKQWQGKTGGGNFGQKFLLRALRSVRVTTLYPVLYCVVPFYCLFGYKAFKCIYRYYREIHHFSKWKSFKNNLRTHFIFGRVVLDKFAVLAGNTDQFTIDIDNETQFQSLLAQPKGFLLVASHIGNFEIIGHCFKQDKKQINCIAYGGESEFFQSRRDESFRRNNVRIIPIKEDMSHIFALKVAIDNGEIVIILCDRIWGSNKTVTVNFMGKEANFPLGTFMMAAKLDIPVVFVATMKEKSTHYQGYIKLLETPDPTQSLSKRSQFLAAQYANAIESVLQKYPEQWFNFYDFWNRNSSI